ncbi:MAG: hypothetical protein M0Z69_10285 [Actinomycetota bacterium]|nr:hypothetical protein [Actinomycetota bacterium]
MLAERDQQAMQAVPEGAVEASLIPGGRKGTEGAAARPGLDAQADAIAELWRVQADAIAELWRVQADGVAQVCEAVLEVLDAPADRPATDLLVSTRP